MKYGDTNASFDLTRLSRSVHLFAVHQALRLANRSGFSSLVPQLIAAACRPVQGQWPNTNHKIWMLGKEGLTEDLLTSLKDHRWAIPLDVSRGIVKGIARDYLPSSIDDNNYGLTTSDIEAAKASYRDAWQVIFRTLPASKRPAAIATGNFGYYAEREMAHAAELENIPFIAIHKECMKSDGRLAFFKTVYQRRGRFSGRKILVYNTRERDLQVEAGVATADQVVVCGMPRLDRLHHWRTLCHPRPDRPTTLLAFGFTPKTGLPRTPHKGEPGKPTRFEYLTPEHEKLGWNDFFRNYHEVLVRIARDNPAWRVQLKLKARHRDAEPAIQLVEQLGAPENFQIVVGGDPIQYLTNADVICGFNTTAILEGLAAGLPVVTPMFDEVKNPAMRDYAPSFGSATHAPDDPRSTYRVLTELMSRRPAPTVTLPHEVSEMLDVWVGNPDGRAGERVCEAFEKEMNTNG